MRTKLILAIHPDFADRYIHRLRAGAIDAASPQSVPAGERQGSVTVIKVRDEISQHFSPFGTSLNSLSRQFDSAIADPNVSDIVFDIDSPGGSVFGLQEFTDKVFEHRGMKPIYAVANSMAASAAFWILSAASKRYVTPGGMVGSVGTLAAHVDASKAWEDLGVKVTLIYAGKYKVEGNSFEPLGEEAKGEIQREVDHYYDQFVTGLARNFGVTKSKVRSDFGEGRMFEGHRAKDAGLVDGVASLEMVVNRIAERRARMHSRQRALKLLELGG